jgi:hypothetical protein
MLGQLIVFSVPIYLRSYKQYYKEHSNYENKELEKFCSLSGESQNEAKKRVGSWLEERCWWPPWQFNDILGYVVVYYDEYSFTAYRYNLDRKRINRDPRKRRGSINFCGKIAQAFAGEPYLDNSDPTNEELRLGLLDFLSEIEETIHRKGWYIDLQYWKNIGASLNCKDFLNRLGASKIAQL